MKLLKTGPFPPGEERLVLETFYDSEIPGTAARSIPEYAILSHTWGRDEDEVQFIDIENGTATQKKAIAKLRYACRQAQSDGYGWVWIDTCCIDKRSSAELSEAINSMFEWYSKSSVCYAYLEDVPSDVDRASLTNVFEQCRWFSRGWTLQELIAPNQVLFFGAAWTPLGDKSTLASYITTRTSIEAAYLSKKQDLASASIAKRMSWASKRETKRGEDASYSLMGLFDVNMPMLYGEGRRKAFLRLQEEIMRVSDDHSLFAWADPRLNGEDQLHGLLADGPECFARGDIIQYSSWARRPPSTMTNHGLSVELPLTLLKDNIYAAALDCPVPPGYQDSLTIPLKRLPGAGTQFARVHCNELGKTAQPGTLTPIHVRQNVTMPGDGMIYPLHCFRLGRFSTTRIAAVDARPKNLPELKHYAKVQLPPGYISGWVEDRVSTVYKIHKESGMLSAAILFASRPGTWSFILRLGSITELTVGYDLVDVSRSGRGSFRLPKSGSLPPLSELQKTFEPKPGGTCITVHDFDVRVDFLEWDAESAKLYIVCVEVSSRQDLDRHGSQDSASPQGPQEPASPQNPPEPAPSQAPRIMAKSLAKLGINIRSPKRP